MTSPAWSWPPSTGAGHLRDGHPAIATYQPRSTAELQSLVREAAAAGLAVYPQGGGTALDYGGTPGRPGVALQMARLDQVIDYPAADLTITVEAGLTLGAIRQLVAQQGQRLAIEAAHPEQATLGGIFATATTGPRRFGWGRPRDQIIGVAFVTGAGELVRGGGRVVKNVAGYDFPKLMTGSLGTLGVITELTLKVNPQPEDSALVSINLKDWTQVGPLLDQLNLSGTRPVALELVGEQGGPWRLLIGLEGNTAAVAWQIDRLAAELDRPAWSVRRGIEAEAAWLDFVESEVGLAPVIAFSASFAPSRAVRFLERVPLDRWSIRVHAGNGIVRGMARTIGPFETWSGELDRLRAEAAALDGTLVLTSCPPALKERHQVWGPSRPDWTIAERVKQALDPGRVLNPGRFIGTI